MCLRNKEFKEHPEEPVQPGKHRVSVLLVMLPLVIHQLQVFQSCNFQDGITPIVVVQMKDDGSIFTKILKIPVNVIVLKQRFKLMPKVCLHLCWLYIEESLLWLIGQTRVW